MATCVSVVRAISLMNKTIKRDFKIDVELVRGLPASDLNLHIGYSVGSRGDNLTGSLSRGRLFRTIPTVPHISCFCYDCAGTHTHTNPRPRPILKRNKKSHGRESGLVNPPDACFDSINRFKSSHSLTNSILQL